MEGMDYKSNQYKDKEKKNIEKIVNDNSKVTVKKRSEVKKFADVFIAEDIHSIKNSIINDILIPSFKKLISDTIKNGIDMMLYGGTTSAQRNSSNRASKVSYRSYYDEPNTTRTIRQTYNYNEILFDERGEAESVLDRMIEIISNYDSVSVADLYDLVGVTGSHTDNKYGWKNLSSASVVREQGGYIIKLPKPNPLD